MSRETTALEAEGKARKREILYEVQDEESLAEIREYLKRQRALEALTRFDQEFFKDEY